MQDQELTAENLREATAETYLAPDEILKEFRQWQEQAVANEEIKLTELLAFDLNEQHFSYAWFTRTPEIEEEKKLKALLFFDHESQSHELFAFARYSEPKYQPVLFAHLFSGRRRDSDFQACIDALGMQAISIDIIFHVEAGDF